MIDIEIGGLDDFEREIDEEINNFKMEAARLLSVIGEEYVIESRTKGSYKDQSTNLRNANSYVVLIDGVELYSNYGREETKEAFQDIITGEGIEFICGNGMEYCSYVEGKGYDVVSSGFLKVIRRINEVFGDN